MPCCVCGKEGSGLKKCSRCHIATYCGKDCQLEDWKYRKHKTKCKPIKSAEQQARKPQEKAKPKRMDLERELFEHEERTSLKGNTLSEMNMLMEMALKMNPDARKKAAKYHYDLYQKCPSFHMEFRRNFKMFYPGVTKDKCFELLHTTVQSVRALFMQEMMLLDEESEWSPEDIFKRLGTNEPKSVDRFLTSSAGSIRKNPGLPYGPVHHSFSNCSVKPHVYTWGTTHISVGFVDLSTLLMSIIKGNEDAKLLWIGIEASSFACAKTMVIVAMLEDENAHLTSILQVWFSSCWSKQTLSDFRDAVRFVLSKDSLDSEVRKILEHWIKVEPLSISKAREAWFKSIDLAIFVPVSNAVRLSDRLAFMNYFLTGQLLEAECGSIVYPCFVTLIWTLSVLGTRVSFIIWT
jgi:hypothetical protein